MIKNEAVDSFGASFKKLIIFSKRAKKWTNRLDKEIDLMIKDF